MVIKDPISLFKTLDNFDFSSKKQLEALENVLELYPDFHLVRTYFLKAVQEQKPEAYDSQLSHTAIATYDRNLLYDFIKDQEKLSLNDKDSHSILKINTPLKEPKKSKLKETKKVSEFQETENTPESLTFADWAHYLKTKKVLNKEKPTLDDKFELIDSSKVKFDFSEDPQAQNKDQILRHVTDNLIPHSAVDIIVVITLCTILAL